LQVIVQRASRWQVLRDVTPLTAGAEDVENAIEHVTDIGLTRAATPLGAWDQGFDVRPLIVGQVSMITLFDGLAIMEFDVLPASASRLL
jgi:hypothetical protein